MKALQQFGVKMFNVCVYLSAVVGSSAAHLSASGTPPGVLGFSPQEHITSLFYRHCFPGGLRRGEIIVTVIDKLKTN